MAYHYVARDRCRGDPSGDHAFAAMLIEADGQWPTALLTCIRCGASHEETVVQIPSEGKEDPL